MADETRNKIEESLKTCLANLTACQTIEELLLPSEIMIRQVASLIRPDFDVEFTPLKKDPQEILSTEESKEETAVDVTFWMERHSIAIKKRAQETLVQISEMLDNRATMTQSLNRMQKFHVHSSQHLKQAIDSFQKEIEEFQNEEGRHLALKVKITKDFIEKIKKAIEQISQNPIKQKIETRYNTPYLDIIEQQDNQYPQSIIKSYENYLIAVQNCGTQSCEFNFRFQGGEKSDLKSNNPLLETKIEPEGAEVKRAVVWYWPSDSRVTCIELYDKEGRKLLEAGVSLYERQRCKNKTHEIILEEGERIIGFKSRKNSETYLRHCDFQFLLGKLI